MRTILLTLTLIVCFNVFIGTWLRGVLCTIVEDGLTEKVKSDQVKWEEGIIDTVQKHNKKFDNFYMNQDDKKELYHNGKYQDQTIFLKQIHDEPQYQDILSFYNFDKQIEKVDVQKSQSKKLHRRRHNRKRNKKNTRHTRTYLKNNSNEEFRNNDVFGYVVDSNNQRFIRQAARSSTKNHAAFAMPTPSNINFNNPMLSTSLAMPSSSKLNYTWPLKRSVDLEGDILLGGLHMVHERNVANVCGTVMGQGGVQAVETMLHAIDYVNNEMTSRGEWIQNVTLGAHILDDCDTDTYGLEMAVDFIKGNEQII